MTKQQEQHLLEIQFRTLELMDKKYRAGVQEYGNNLWDLGIERLLYEAINESIDQLAYLFTVRDKIRGVEAAEKNNYISQKITSENTLTEILDAGY